MNTSYVITGLAIGLAVLAPRLSAIEQKTVGQDRGTEEREAFTREVEKELANLDRQIDELQARAKELGRKGRLELEVTTRRLERKEARAQKRLQELKTSSGERWRQFRGHVSDLVEGLEEDVSAAVKDVQEEKEERSNEPKKEEKTSPLP